MTLPIEHKAGDFYVIKNAPEKPKTKGWMSAGECGCYHMTTCACMDYQRALAYCERLKIVNPETAFKKDWEGNWIIKDESPGMVEKWNKLTDGQIIYFEGSYEERCIAKHCDCPITQQRCINLFAVLLPQEEQKSEKEELTNFQKMKGIRAKAEWLKFCLDTGWEKSR